MHDIRWGLKASCLYFIFAGLYPWAIAVVAAMANSPQSLLPFCIWKRWTLIVRSLKNPKETTKNSFCCFVNRWIDRIIHIHMYTSLPVPLMFEAVIQWSPRQKSIWNLFCVAAVLNPSLLIRRVDYWKMKTVVSRVCERNWYVNLTAFPPLLSAHGHHCWEKSSSASLLQTQQLQSVALQWCLTTDCVQWTCPTKHQWVY